jgi:drug/metabolite transporter (DMT)-like permease
MKTKEKAVTYMVYSSLFLSLLNFSIKGCIGPLGVSLSTFFRYFAPLVLIAPYFAFRRQWRHLRPEVSIGLHLLRGFCAVVGQTSLNYYLTRASLVNATMLWATGPIYVPIIIYFLYKQKTPRVTWISIFISIVGVVLMIKPTHGIFDPFSIWGILSGVAMAFSQVLWGRNAEKGSITENLLYLYLFASVLAFTAWMLFGAAAESVSNFSPLIWVSLIGVALSSLGNQIFRSKAYQIVPSYLLMPILYIAVLGSGIIDVVFYNEWPDLWKYIGFALVCIGTYIKWRYLKKTSERSFN